MGAGVIEAGGTVGIGRWKEGLKYAVALASLRIRVYYRRGRMIRPYEADRTGMMRESKILDGWLLSCCSCGGGCKFRDLPEACAFCGEGRNVDVVAFTVSEAEEWKSWMVQSSSDQGAVA